MMVAMVMVRAEKYLTKKNCRRICWEKKEQKSGRE